MKKFLALFLFLALSICAFGQKEFDGFKNVGLKLPYKVVSDTSYVSRQAGRCYKFGDEWFVANGTRLLEVAVQNGSITLGSLIVTGSSTFQGNVLIQQNASDEFTVTSDEGDTLFLNVNSRLRAIDLRIPGGTSVFYVDTLGNTYTADFLPDQIGGKIIVVGTDTRFSYVNVDAAFGAASAGDVILVLPGTYTGHVDADVAGVTVVSWGGPEVTTLALTMTANAGMKITGANVSIKGFTMTGNAAGSIIEISGAPADVLIEDCVINSTGSATFGSTISTDGADGTIFKNCTFRTNAGDGAFYGNKTVTNIQFIGNTFIGQDSTSGYAIQIAGVDNMIVQGNTIKPDEGKAGSFASGVFVHTVSGNASDSVYVENNVIAGCSKGVRLGHSTQTFDLKAVFITGNTFNRNTSGVYIANDAQVYPATYQVNGNIFYDNFEAINNDNTTALAGNTNIFETYILTNQIAAGGATRDSSVTAVGGHFTHGLLVDRSATITGTLNLGGGTLDSTATVTGGGHISRGLAIGKNLTVGIKSGFGGAVGDSTVKITGGLELTHGINAAGNVLIGGTLGVTGAVTVNLLGADTLTIASRIVPDATGSADIGSPSLLFDSLYVSNIFDGTASWASSSLSGFTSIQSQTLTLGLNGTASGQITFIASDNDQGTFAITTADALEIAGFGGGVDVDGNFTAGSVTSDAGLSGLALTVGTDDVNTGDVILYGDNADAGAKITMYNSANEDGTEEFWTLEPAGTSFHFGPASDNDIIIFTNAGNITTLGNLAGATYASDASISDAELKTLDDGALTDILVGGGAGSAPVWTAATGTGSPVRATAPTFPTTITLGSNGGTSGQINFVASDNDQGSMAITTADKLSHSGFSGGYGFDENVTIVRSSNAGLTLQLSNTTDGTGAYTGFTVTGGANATYLYASPATNTTLVAFYRNKSLLTSSAPSLIIGNETATTGKLEFAAGGNTTSYLWQTIEADGDMVLGGNAAPVSGYITIDKGKKLLKSGEGVPSGADSSLIMDWNGITLKDGSGNTDFSLDGDGNVTAAGTIEGGTLTDGTASLTAGAWTGATYNGLSITAAGNTFNLQQGTGSLDVAAAKVIDFDMDFTVDGTATTITGVTQANTITLNEGFTIGDGYTGTLTFSAATKTLTVEETSLVNQDLTSDASPTFAGVNAPNFYNDNALTVYTTGAADDIKIDPNTAGTAILQLGETGDNDTTRVYGVLDLQENKFITTQEFTWNIGAFDFIEATYIAAEAAVHPVDPNGIIYAPVKVPYNVAGGKVVIDQITVYYNTVDSGDDFDFALVRTDVDGTITVDEDQDDIGNSTTGAQNTTLLVADLELSDFAYYIEIDVNNTDGATDVKIYMIKIEAHLE